jgi:hypothetical protein
MVLISGNASAQSTEVMLLSGTGNDHTVDWEFHIDRGNNSGVWTTIPVPSNWELQGFGVYNYGRGNNEFSDETGRYRHRFEVPAAWRGKAVHIVFEGVMTDTEVQINGEAAGPVHQGGFYRFKYDVSRLLRYGEANLLEVTVKNWSDNASVNTAERESDYWVFGGIYRPVYLEAKPAEHIVRTAIDAGADGSFSVDVYLNGITSIRTVEAQIFTLDGRAAGPSFSAGVGADAEHVRLESRLEDPRLWSPEFPNRYRVEIRLKKGGEILHSQRETFGFRTVELRRHDGIYVNGRKVIFKGVNRHSFWPESGRCTSRALSIRDVELMKDMNMNAVRMSHYPPDEHFLEACDSLGLFVLDELAGWQTAYDTEVGEKLVREMIIRDVNHPSIVVWDNGNEGGWNAELDDDFHRYDPQKRPLIHPWAKFQGADTRHYISYDCCFGTGFHSPEVFFPTEFLHGLYDGGHGAGLEDYWTRMMDMPNCAGGFLWVFADEGVVRTDQDGRIDTWGSNAPDGILGPFREKEGSFYTIKELWNPVRVEAPPNMKYFDGRLRVHNDYFYTGLQQCKFQWQLIEFPAPDEAATGAGTVTEGSAKPPSVPPGEQGWLILDLPGDWKTADGLRLRIEDPHGRELFTYTFPIKTPEEVAQRLIPTGTVSPRTGEDPEFYFLRSGTTEVVIDRRTGMIRRMERNGNPVSFNDGPRLDPTTGTYRLQGIQPMENGLRVRFEASQTGDRNGISWTVQYTMLPDGWLQIDYEYQPPQGQYDYLGIHFDYPEEKVNGVRWLGKGPYRVWKNRMKGPQLGVWAKDYNNTITGETLWEYPEFKGYHANLYWAVLDTDEGPLTIAASTPGLFLRLYTPQPPEGAYNDHTDGIFPEGDLSIMHAIPPIGTKFKEAGALGPQGQPHQVHHNRSSEPLRGRIFVR